MEGMSAIIRKAVPALLMAVVVLGLCGPLTAAHAQDNGLVPALLLLAPDFAHSEGLTQLQALIEAGGGQVIHTFPYQAVIAQLPADTLSQMESQSGVAAVYTTAVDLSTMGAYGPDVPRFAGVWNALIAPQMEETEAVLAAAGEGDLANDALAAPDVPTGGQMSATADAAAVPGYHQTSEFMAGSVAVGIVLVESDGSVDSSTENWTADEKQLVFNKVVAACSWWAGLEDRAHLSFVYDDHYSNPLPTSLEPITHGISAEAVWIAEAMSGLGYQAPSYFTRVRDYVNDLRDTYNTDWAFAVFVVDGSADADGMFSDGMFAYSYVGGPFLVLNYGNDGYGPTKLDIVAAHEIGHVFLALDQYYSAHQSCTTRSGYLDVENQNSLYGDCASDASSIMRTLTVPFQQGDVDRYGRGQVGWRDTDSDGILDPLDTDLQVSMTSVSQSGDAVTIHGAATVVPYASTRRTTTTINHLTHVQYRVDGGDWLQATADDSAFDGVTEAYHFTTASLAPGLRNLEIAASDSAGNVSGSYATRAVAVLDPVDGGLTTELQPFDTSAAADGAFSVSGVAYHLQDGIVARVQFRLDGGSWQDASPSDGAFDSWNEPFVLTITSSLGGGTHLIEARATDGDGYAEVNFASYALGTTYTISLPIVTRAG
jgi:hypothetical protein